MLPHFGYSEKGHTMEKKLFTGYTMVITRLRFPPKTGVHRTPYDLCGVEYMRDLDPDTYWVRVHEIGLAPVFRWYTAIFTQEQLDQSLPLKEPCYLASKQIVAPHQPALTAQDHGFLGGFVVQPTLLLDGESWLCYARPVIFDFEGLPQKMALPREQLTTVLPIAEWRKRYTRRGEKEPAGQSSWL